jgi:glutamate/tyrosine decarboxylase-like PLP-dependent enzyme
MYPSKDEITPALDLVARLSSEFLATIDERRPAAPPRPRDRLLLSESGLGASAALSEFWQRYGDDFAASTGPRYWGFVHGGVTPAALAGDWLCAATDQTGQNHGDSPGTQIEAETTELLRELFGLPDAFSGNFVSGGTMANLSGLAIGLQRLGAARGVNVAQDGVAQLAPVRILTGEGHASIDQAAAMLGLGRASVERIERVPDREQVSIAALRARLEQLGDAPAIIVGNAGTVNTGDFDDLDALADLAEAHRAHFHVDGAFGLFAAASPQFAPLVKGIGRADTISGDAHKFLNVPYDSGFLFTRHLEPQIEMFKSPSAYLPTAAVDPLAFQNRGPENSRRSRAIPAWMTLQAYGRDGYREIVERCCANARGLADALSHTPGFKLAAPVRFNVVCFQLDGANADDTKAFVDRLIADGRVVVSKSVLRGKPCIRLAMVNWRTTPDDVRIALAALTACRLFEQGRRR